MISLITLEIHCLQGKLQLYHWSINELSQEAHSVPLNYYRKSRATRHSDFSCSYNWRSLGFCGYQWNRFQSRELSGLRARSLLPPIWGCQWNPDCFHSAPWNHFPFLIPSTLPFWSPAKPKPSRGSFTGQILLGASPQKNKLAQHYEIELSRGSRSSKKQRMQLQVYKVYEEYRSWQERAS